MDGARESDPAASSRRHRDESSADGLSDRDTAILEFERRWWRHAGAKEQAIRDEFGLSSARYYQVLGALIDAPAALVHDPMLIKRLQRTRDARVTARATRTLYTD
ncbi:DUF3263 domain-containing protein [Rathayibacter soli]|uniref:DUF3263 domain-containing protein n=1 Tax=Rathayibacter soli TaxID=3144168 RepID=UPI0027E4925D|nr:DUF3263 domain-containing protein [Glaciibacter superstes]